MGSLDQDSIRYKVLQNAKDFKTSWLELGQALYSVWKDRLYKDWGYVTFDAYTAKEIGIKKMTAMKLLKSYYFLEKEEPGYLQKSYEPDEVNRLPNYESVNVLRLAKNKRELDAGDYAHLKKDVFEMGRDASDVKKDLTQLMRQKEELEPAEARKKKREATIKRLLSTLRSLKTEIEVTKVLPSDILKQTKLLIDRIEAEIE